MENKLKEIHVTVVIPNYIRNSYYSGWGDELNDRVMKNQAIKMRQAISGIQSDYSFDIIIEEIKLNEEDSE